MISLIKPIRILPLLFIVGCIAPPSLYKEAFVTSKEAFLGSNIVISKAIRELPYAMQLVQIGSSKEVLLVLAESRNDSLVWSSSSKELITTFNGKIIKTLGLKNDIEIIAYPNILEAYSSLLKNNMGYSHKSFVNFSSPKATSLEVLYTYKILKDETILKRLNDLPVATKVMIEYVNIPIIRFRAKNLYWIDSEMNVLKSEQKIVPNIKIIKLDTLKKYNGS